MSLTVPQKRIIHVAKAKLGFSDNTYRAILVRIAGVTSSTELDREGFEAIMGYFDYCGFRPLETGAPRYGDRPGMATYAQLELIRELWREVHQARTCDDEHLMGWLRKCFKVDSMRFLTMEGARKAITALKAWKARPKVRAA
ncbi:MAG: regulatory protein GemA [Pseudorhodobacter sp.]